MKLITLTLILLATFVIPAKEKDSDCIKELNKCRTVCYEKGITDGECILKCYKDADGCK